MVTSNVVIVAHTYASALLKAATSSHSTLAVSHQLLFALTKLSLDAKLRITLRNPTLPKEAKVKSLTEILPDPPHPLVLNLIKTLVDNNRTNIFLEIVKGYIILQAMQDGALPTKFVTAKPLDQQNREKIVTNIESSLKIKIIPSFQTDSSILGGIKIYVGSYLLDKSWTRKVESLTQFMEGR